MLERIKRNLLKYTLIVDGIVSVVAGVAFLGLSGLVADLLGPAFSAGIIMGLGALLFVWGLFHLAMSGQSSPSASGVRIAIAGDALWVLGSIAVLIIDWDGLSAIGATAIAVLAVAVADIMLLKMKGLGDERKAALAV
jgi:hypothetical protein